MNRTDDQELKNICKLLAPDAVDWLRGLHASRVASGDDRASALAVVLEFARGMRDGFFVEIDGMPVVREVQRVGPKQHVQGGLW